MTQIRALFGTEFAKMEIKC